MRHRRRAAEGRRRRCRAGARPGPAAGLRQRAGHRAGPAAGAAGRGAHRRDLPGRRGGHRAGPARRPDPGGPEPAGAPGPGRAAQADVRRAPVRGADSGARRGPRGRPAAAAGPARRAGPPDRRDAGAGRRHRAGEGAATRAERASAAGPAAASWSTCRRRPPLEPGPLLLVDRPGSVQSSLRIAPARGAAHPPRPRRAAAGQPGLRRLLLVPLGGEHPRGQGLHVRPALGDRALGRRVGAGRRRRGGHRGHRARRCWRRSTSWAGWRRCRPSADELEQARQYALGTLQLGMSTQAGLAGAGQRVRRVRPAPGLPGRVRGAAGDGDPRRRRGGGGTLSGAGRAVAVVLGDADRVEAPGAGRAGPRSGTGRRRDAAGPGAGRGALA